MRGHMFIIDDARLEVLADGSATLDKEGVSIATHHDDILAAVMHVEMRDDAFFDEHDSPTPFSYTPKSKDSPARITFMDGTASLTLAYTDVLEFASERLQDYMHSLIDGIPTPKEVYAVADNILGVLEAAALDDDEILNQAGWVIMRTNPLEAFHPETGSTANGDAVRYLTDGLRIARASPF